MRPEDEKSSSSSSSSDEEEDEETEAAAVRRVPAPESSSEDEDEDDGDEEQEEESEEPPTVKAQPKPPADPHRKPMDTSTKEMHGKNPDSSSKKRPSDENQVVDSAKRKKASNQITTEAKEASSVQRQSFQRVWSIEDEKNLISSFQEFIQKKSGSPTAIAAFFNFWEERGGKFRKKQVKDKLRRLREKYSTRQKMEQRGESKGFATYLERDIYTISKEIWGSKEDENTGKGEKKGKKNQGSSNKEGNKEKREENKGRAEEESNSKKKKKEKVKSVKKEIFSPKRSEVGVAEEDRSKEEKKEKSDSNKKEPCAPQGSPKPKVGDEVAKPPRDTKILDEKPNAGGDSVDSNSMESWRILVKPPSKLVGLYEAVEKGVMSSTKLKMSELEVTRRKLEKMRSEIDAELIELTFQRAVLALEVMRAVQSACEKAKEQ